ncbi:restriction endonuclease subunit S [Halopseudomonas aestusnigri]|uniref:restriction endonuclease subunit S n=1 Tax=Halopseudomonas aestusnigri TaxID=857252 RepID=UPI0025543581|nr:restriction endonuclease subunit S [Halopseudomonas aestusnigri]MDL2200247.1 restriction endonuclease subunit S [Halopseudomonas aestusnigri]
MTALLTDNLPLLAGAPNGIKKLRELILELAVRGKLVPQDPNDEPASELLIRIAEEKARLVAEGKIKKQKALTAIAEEDQPFELPAGWAWAGTATLTLLITDGTHHTPTYISSGVPFISVKDIDGTTISFDNCKYISQEEHVAINARCNPELGDILLCRIGTLGRPTIVDTVAPFSLFVSVGLLKLPKKTEISRYFHCVLSSPLMYRQYDQIKAGGSHTNKLNLGDIPRLLVPVPPLAEQHRIVAKVDELMALCDRLEARQADADSAHTQLVQALLNSLTRASDADDFAHSWQRLAEHFHTLLTTESSIDALKQTLLQLAVMGKLVPQDPSDEPASELLKRIAEEKIRLIAEGKIRKPKKLAALAEDEKGFELAAGWEWSRLGDHVLESGAGWSPSCESRPRSGNDWGVLKVSAVSWGTYRPEENKALPIHLAPRPEHEVAEDDFLVSRANTADLVARSVVVHTTPKRLMLSDKIVRLKLNKLCDRRYINLANSAPHARQYYAQVAGGTSSSMKNVSREQILSLPVALPPLAEQHRIVAKVDQLMALCDQLKTRLSEARQLHEQLASTLVEQAVA